MRGFHTAALFAVVALALCAGGAADTNTPQARGTGASNIGTADARLSLNITTAAERPQGSDADELTRGRRPNWGGKWKNSYRDEHHGNKHKPNKHKPNKHRPNKPKPEVPAYCTPEKSCEAHSDCHKLLPCQETYCKNYKCVCEGIKTGPCIPKDDTIEDCTGPLGNCNSTGHCEPLNTDNGCPCNGEPDNRDCLEGLNANKLACVNPLQMCKCGDGLDAGKCVPNYLPPDTACDREGLGACQVGKCDARGKCRKRHADNDTACFADFGGVGSDSPDPTCANAGVCKDGDCANLFCDVVEEAEKCAEKFTDKITGCTTGESCGTGNADCDQACHDATNGTAACLLTQGTCSCKSPGGGQTQFNCVLDDGNPPVGEGDSRCCVCKTPDSAQ